MSLKNVNFRTILDKKTNRVSLFVVINGEFWTTAERLQQAVDATPGTVIVADTRDEDGEVKDSKSIVAIADGKSIGFVKNGKAVAKLSREFVADLAIAMIEPEFAPKVADAARATQDAKLFA